MEAAQFAIWPVVAVVNAEGTKVGGGKCRSLDSISLRLMRRTRKRLVSSVIQQGIVQDGRRFRRRTVSLRSVLAASCGLFCWQPFQRLPHLRCRLFGVTL